MLLVLTFANEIAVEVFACIVKNSQIGQLETTHYVYGKLLSLNQTWNDLVNYEQWSKL